MSELGGSMNKEADYRLVQGAEGLRVVGSGIDVVVRDTAHGTSLISKMRSLDEAMGRSVKMDMLRALDIFWEGDEL
jgi:hypothetical protein